MTVHDRWFITPVETVPDPSDDADAERIPKYSDDDRVGGYSGVVIEASSIETTYAGLVATYTDIDEWYVVRMYGRDTPGYNVLNEIHNELDTRTLADHAHDVKPVIDAHIQGSRPAEAYAESFQCSMTEAQDS